ncbi:MAG: rod shape-determining protein MreD, partial [Kiritimatiellia bacterium]|nr:rod shape-determining protein MreD [Kiritimatiellia bacterium]
MTVFSMIVVMLLGGVLQAVLPTAAWLGEVRPPVLLSLALYYALTRERIPLGAALTAGLVQDALGLLPLGVSPLCFCVAVLLIHRNRDSIFIGQGVTHMVLGSLAAGLVTFALYLLLAVSDLLHLPASRVALKMFGAMVLGGLTAPLLYALMER